jgi:DNA-binding LacI/PurR family transcriptional regulator
MVSAPKRPVRRSQRARLEDIARQFDVSIATVSRALGDQPGVRADLEARIRDAALRFSYALPSPVAGRRAIVAASSAAMVDYTRSQFTLHVLEGIAERATALGMEIETRSIADADQGRALLDEARAAEDVAGLLFLTLDDEAMLAPTRGHPKPIVLVNGDDPSMRLSSVAPCNRAAAALATDHLRALGHERILFLMRRGRRTIERRFEGWRDRMPAMDPARLGDLVIEVDDWLPELAQGAIERRLDWRGRDFTAILAAGDSLAIGAAMALAARGIKVPDDVSIIGMDGLPQGAFANPPLSAVVMPMREIGSVALDLLRDKASGAETTPRRVELACHLLERKSTAPARP